MAADAPQEPRLLTHAQEQIWAGQRLRPDSPVANMGHLVWFDAAVDPIRFVRALDVVVDAHEALRTVYPPAPVAGSIEVAPLVLAGPPTRTEVITIDADSADSWIALRVAESLPIGETVYDSVLLRCGDRDGWLFTVHHLAVDAGAFAVIFEDLAAAYNGQSVSPSSHRDYVAELAPLQRTDRWTAARRYWDDRVIESGTPSLFHVATEPGTASSRRQVQLSDATRAKLDALLGTELRAISDELALMAVLATTTAVLRHRLDGSESTVIGIPLHQRDRASARVVGCLMELFPLQVEIEHGESFRVLHKRVLGSLLRLIANARPGTSPAQGFDIVLNILNSNVGDFGSISTEASSVFAGALDVNHALRVQAADWSGSGEFDINLNINHSVATADQIERTPLYFATVLEALVANLDAPIGGFPLLTDAEAELLRSYNDVVSTDPLTITAIQQLREVLADLDSPVVLSNDHSYSGRELLTEIDRVARWLLTQGVEPGDLVGVQMPTGVDALIAIYAILTVGAVFVPLDPEYPPARLEYLCADAHVTLVVERLPDAHLESEGAQRNQANFAAVAPGLDDVAYLIYTSGSTGLPKGVPISHRGLQEHLRFAMHSHYGPHNQGAEPTVTPLFTSLSFDATMTTVFAPILSGGIVSCQTGRGIEALAEIVEQARATVMKCTPSHIKLLLQLIGPGHPLEAFVIGGEPLTRALALQLQELLGPQVAIYNSYGPAETAIACMYHRFDSQVDTGAQVPIGVPAPSVTLLVLDAYGHPAPLGVNGELFIHRPGMCEGYFRRAELSAERFLPAGERHRLRLYRTGDLVRLDEHNTDPDARGLTMTFVARVDDQVKLQGIRLEPGEVEAVLLEHESVRQAAVRLRQTEDGRQLLVAWYVAEDDVSNDVVRAHAATLLPHEVLPSAFVAVEEIPITVNGKVAVDLLPVPHDRSDHTAAGFEPPSNAVEETICGLWLQLLAVDRVGIDDDFFDLGGASLRALEVLAWLSDHYEISLAAETAFTHRTVRSMAQAIERQLIAEIEAMDDAELAAALDAPTHDHAVETGS